MGVTSKTGLLPTKKNVSIIYPRRPPVHLKAVTSPAPYILKPFAGIYNPYPYGCSLLCNHPADTEAKDLLKRAKDTWATEGKSLLLAEEVAAIRAGLEQIQIIENTAMSPRKYEFITNVESVPEELFRRYTETDSRPLTPTPTVISIRTKASGSRRCITPDPIFTSEVKEKTQLILDLRRSHSQETLSWFGSSQQAEPPIIRIQQVPTRSTSPESCLNVLHDSKKKNFKTLHPPGPAGLKKQKIEHVKPDIIKTQHLEVAVFKPETDEELVHEEENAINGEEEDGLKRRGKKKRKRGRDSSRGPPAFQSSVDPETQVATIDNDSHNPSARPSLIPNGENQDNKDASKSLVDRKSSLDVNSYLDKEILRQLRRELNEEIVDNEFNFKRKKALEEALKTVSPNKTLCEELIKLQKELQLPAVDTEFWLSLPRVFSRSSARFELPMDSRMFSKLTPMDYVKDSIVISSSRKLLYNCIFNRNKVEYEEDVQEQERKMIGQEVMKALGEMMGKALTDEQANIFRELVGWSDEDVFDFKTFCGLCALCERLLAPEYYPQLPSKAADPCHEIEVADFESLERRLRGQDTDPRLTKILYAIKNS